MCSAVHALCASGLFVAAGCSAGYAPTLPDAERAKGQDAALVAGHDLACADLAGQTELHDGKAIEPAEPELGCMPGALDTQGQDLPSDLDEAWGSTPGSEDGFGGGVDDIEADGLNLESDNIALDAESDGSEPWPDSPDSDALSNVCQEGAPTLFDECGAHCCGDKLPYIQLCAESFLLEPNVVSEVVALSRCGTTTVIGIRFVGDTGFFAAYGLTVAKSGLTKSLWGQHPFYQLETGEKLSLGVWIDSGQPESFAALTVGYAPFATQNLSPGVILDSNGLLFITP